MVVFFYNIKDKQNVRMNLFDSKKEFEGEVGHMHMLHIIRSALRVDTGEASFECVHIGASEGLICG